MIVCSCLGITDRDIEQALVDVLSRPESPLPTPGVIYRRLEKKMVCCGCAPLVVWMIYQKVGGLADKGVTGAIDMRRSSRRWDRHDPKV